MHRLEIGDAAATAASILHMQCIFPLKNCYLSRTPRFYDINTHTYVLYVWYTDLCAAQNNFQKNNAYTHTLLLLFLNDILRFVVLLYWLGFYYYPVHIHTHIYFWVLYGFSTQHTSL